MRERGRLVILAAKIPPELKRVLETGAQASDRSLSGHVRHLLLLAVDAQAAQMANAHPVVG